MSKKLIETWHFMKTEPVTKKSESRIIETADFYYSMKKEEGIFVPTKNKKG